MRTNSSAVLWVYHVFDWLSDFIRDLVAFSFIIFAILTFIACLGYSPNDPSFLQATDTVSGNWLGLHGATYADIVLQTLGLSGYLISCFLLLWGTALFRGRIKVSIILRLMYLSPILLVASATTHILFTPTLGHIYEQGAGGFLGQNVANVFKYIFSIIGLGNDFIVGTFCIFISAIGLIFLSGRQFLVTISQEAGKNNQENKKETMVSSINDFMKLKKSGYLIKSKVKKYDETDEEQEGDRQEKIKISKNTKKNSDEVTDEDIDVKQKSNNFI